MSKNLTFKLILDGDNKGLVAAAKQSESTVKAVFDAIKSESDNLKQSTVLAAKEIGNIVPQGTTELADKLSQSLNAATGIIRGAGDNAKITASNFTDFGNKAEKALNTLKSDLTTAQQKLKDFSNTTASPADIEKAKVQVDQLEKEVQQADQAFNNFHAEVGRANTSLKDTDSAAKTAQMSLGGAKTAATAFAGAMATLGVGLGLRELAETADSYTNLSARINIATKDNGNFEGAMAGVHLVALQTNSSLQSTGDLFTRLNAVGKEMGMSQQNTLDLTKTINQAIQISGVSAQASEAFTTQFIQSMQQGVLRGEEYNSMMENGYEVSNALAKGLGVTTGELKNMADNGELGAERVYKALLSQRDSVQQTFDQFPTTISNALQRILTSWETLIGKMDQSTGASASVAQWLVTLADNIADLDVVLNDIGEGFVWVGDQFKKIDPSTIQALKAALLSIYDALKILGSTVGDSFEAAVDIINSVLLQLFNFSSGVDTASDKTNGFTKVLQLINIAISALSDGFAAIGIGVNLFVGTLYSVGAAWANLASKFTWGEVKQEALANLAVMQAKSEEYYKKASDDALNFKSKAVEALNEIGKTQDQKNAEAVASSKNKLDQLLLDQQTEVNAKKISEEEKIGAVQAYAEATVTANKGVLDGVMQADLMTKGYIVTVDQAGKVSVEAWSKAEVGADNSAKAIEKARIGAKALDIDLDVALNRVSEKFTANQKSLNDYANNLEALGVTGTQAGELTYQAWMKWLETAKSQAEIDFAKAKLKEFGNQGKISTSQVEMGMQAIRQVVQKLPADIDPVTAAFERLGIKTKEQLALAAQSALADFNTIQSSGQATAESLKQAYERTMQAAAASGDQAVIASTQAKAASLGLQVQVDQTGKVTVASMDEVVHANERVRSSAEQIGDGYRQAGLVAREEAQNASEAWDAALKKSREEFQARGQPTTGRSGGSYESYSKGSVLAELKNMGYSDAEANKLVGSIMSSAFDADKSAMSKNMGSGNAKYLNAGFEKNLSQGLTSSFGSQVIQERLQQLANGIGLESMNPPKISAPNTPTISEPKNVNYSIQFGGKTLEFSGSSDQENVMNQLINQLKTQAKSS